MTAEEMRAIAENAHFMGRKEEAYTWLQHAALCERLDALIAVQERVATAAEKLVYLQNGGRNL